MQLGSLKVYCDVARHRSFSQAAQANQITQSAASQIVSQLEKRMEVRLIDRSTRPLQLTESGREFYEGCKTLLQQYFGLEDKIRNGKVAPIVQVAAIYSVGLGDMGQYVQRFARLAPGAQVHIDYLHPDRVYERVLEGSADLGLVSFPHRSAKLEIIPWRDEEMVLACSPKHPLAGRDRIRPSELEGHNYVHFDGTLDIRKKVDQFLREHEASVEVVVEFDSIENIKQAVALGTGVALLPEPTFKREVKARTLVAVPLSEGRLVRPLAIVHRRRPALSTAAASFIKILKDEDAAGARRMPNVAPLVGGNVHRNGNGKK